MSAVGDLAGVGGGSRELLAALAAANERLQQLGETAGKTNREVGGFGDALKAVTGLTGSPAQLAVRAAAAVGTFAGQVANRATDSGVSAGVAADDLATRFFARIPGLGTNQDREDLSARDRAAARVSSILGPMSRGGGEPPSVDTIEDMLRQFETQERRQIRTERRIRGVVSTQTSEQGGDTVDDVIGGVGSIFRDIADAMGNAFNRSGR